VSTEEAFVQTTSLAQGLTLKAGRYFSGIGYLNEQHAHAWTSSMRRCLTRPSSAASSTTTECTALAGAHRHLPGSRRGTGPRRQLPRHRPQQERRRRQRGFRAYGRRYRRQQQLAGRAFPAEHRAQDRQWNDIDAASAAVTNSFTGSSKLWIADAVWKWAPNGNANNTYFKLQGEYLRRGEDGNVTYNGASTASYAATQSAGICRDLPVRALLAPGPAHRAARYRHGRLRRQQRQPVAAGLRADPQRADAGLNPSEFARLRLQFAQDKSRQGVTDNQSSCNTR